MPFCASMISDFLGRIGAVYSQNNVHRMETWLAPDHFIANTALSRGFEMGKEPIGIFPLQGSFILLCRLIGCMIISIIPWQMGICFRAAKQGATFILREAVKFM